MYTLLEIGLWNAMLATVLALVVVVVTWFWRRSPLVYCLWLLVLLKLVTPPVVWFPVALSVNKEEATLRSESRRSTAETVQRAKGADALSRSAVGRQIALDVSGPAPLAVDGPSPERADLAVVESSKPMVSVWAWANWRTLVLSVWLSGSGLWFGLAGVRILRFGRVVKDAQDSPKHLQEEAQRLARQFGIRRCPTVRVVTGRVPPLLWAMTSGPTVVVPSDLFDKLSLDEQRTLLAHEIAHFRRRDHWVRWIELLALGLYWWHPVAWWARSKLQQAEEESCDAWVVSTLPELARDYAQVLMQTVDFVSAGRPAAPIGASGFGQAHAMKRRLKLILDGDLPHRLSWWVRTGVILLSVVVLPCSGYALWVESAEVEAGAVAPVALDAKANEDEESRKIEASLDALVEANFVEKPLSEVVDALSRATGVKIHLDPQGLSSQGIRPDTPVTTYVRDRIPLRTALNFLLDPLHLTIAAKGDVLHITSDQGNATETNGQASESDLNGRLKKLEELTEELLYEVSALKNGRARGEALAQLRRSFSSLAAEAEFGDIEGAFPRPQVSKEVIAGFVTALKDEDEKVQLRAMAALKNIGDDSEEVIDALASVLQDGSEPLRILAAELLGQIGSGSEDTTGALLSALKDESPRVREAAVQALDKALSSALQDGSGGGFGGGGFGSGFGGGGFNGGGGGFF